LRISDCGLRFAPTAGCHAKVWGLSSAPSEIRRRLKLPPFSTLIQLTLHASKHDKVQQAAEALAAALESSKPRRVELLGPAPHRIPKLRNSYRMCILLKGPKAEPMVAWLRRVLQPSRRFDGLPVTVDVDPQSVA
jgi:primosomal protein N'